MYNYSAVKKFIEFTEQRYKKFYKKSFNPTIMTAKLPGDIIAYICKQCEGKDTKNNGKIQGCLGKSVSAINPDTINNNHFQLLIIMFYFVVLHCNENTYMYR